MIKVYCDVCNDEIGLYDCKNKLPDDGIPKSGVHFNHLCSKCCDIQKNLNMEELIKKIIIDKRTDIPKERKKCPHCNKHI